MTAPAAQRAPTSAPKSDRAFIRIEDVVKTFDGFRAVDQVSLDVAEGEIFCLLGGSGSGKSTLLRMLAGFETPDAGRIEIDGQDMTSVPPWDRPVNMMFQSYALFPHMSVEKNIAYGLKQDGMSKADIQAQVKRMLDLVKLSQFGHRKPTQLSGGQRQRVALARALAKKPKALLLDEPLSALDKKLRADLQWELKALHEKLGVTFIYVTHDQEEALSMSDRIVILSGGKIQQAGDPETLYNRPRTGFVANFLGKSNFADAKVLAHLPGAAACDLGGAAVEIESPAPPPVGTTARIALRPERIVLGAAGGPGVPGRVAQISYLGERAQLIVETDSLGPLLVSRPTWKAGIHPERDLPVTLTWDRDACVFLEEA